VDRTFAFNFLYYAEGGLNYGLTGRAHTPLRALAAYAAAIHFLSGKMYVGDLPNKVGPAGRGRVFAGPNGTGVVAVVFAGSATGAEFSGTGQPASPPGPMWSWSIPITGAYAADGRPVHYQCSDSSGCQWGNPDRLSYLTLEASVLAVVSYPTVASMLGRFGDNNMPLEGTASLFPADSLPRQWSATGKDLFGVVPRMARPLLPPVLLQLRYDNTTYGVDHAQLTYGSAVAYTVDPATASAVNMTFLLHGMASCDGTITVRLAGRGVSPASQASSVTHGQVASISFTVDVASAIMAVPSRMATLLVTATGYWGAGNNSGEAWADRLAINLQARNISRIRGQQAA